MKNICVFWNGIGIVKLLYGKHFRYSVSELILKWSKFQFSLDKVVKYIKLDLSLHLPDEHSTIFHVLHGSNV